MRVNVQPLSCPRGHPGIIGARSRLLAIGPRVQSGSPRFAGMTMGGPLRLLLKAVDVLKAAPVAVPHPLRQLAASAARLAIDLGHPAYDSFTLALMGSRARGDYAIGVVSDVVEYHFDPSKDTVNRAKHGVSLALAEVLFAGPHLTLGDDRFDYGNAADRFRTYSRPVVRLSSLSTGTRSEGSSRCARPIPER